MTNKQINLSERQRYLLQCAIECDSLQADSKYRKDLKEMVASGLMRRWKGVANRVWYSASELGLKALAALAAPDYPPDYKPYQNTDPTIVSMDDLPAELARLRAENEKLQRTINTVALALKWIKVRPDRAVTLATEALKILNTPASVEGDE